MRVIRARNVHDALPIGLRFLRTFGRERDSRLGRVIVCDEPVSTIYEKPYERVIFHPLRDANPFFHLYESLWMLAGRSDVEGLSRYLPKMAEYSEDGKSLFATYGHRWRVYFGRDQLLAIEGRLTKNRDDRRVVLQMWDTENDLFDGVDAKDVPCNLIATLQIADGKLNIVVFCRSNDVIWGAYGANAVQFSTLQEYLAHRIGVGIGTYTQVSVNFHAYVDRYEEIKSLADHNDSGFNWMENPYATKVVKVLPMFGVETKNVEVLLRDADHGVLETPWDNDWINMVRRMLFAHQIYRTKAAPEKYTDAIGVIANSDIDWHVAGVQWLERRFAKWDEKMANEWGMR